MSSLLGRVVLATTEGRDLFNTFYLVAAETDEAATLVPLETDVSWDKVNTAWGMETPRVPDDPAAALAACPNPIEAKKRFVDRDHVYLRVADKDYHLWSGEPVPCRWL